MTLFVTVTFLAHFRLKLCMIMLKEFKANLLFVVKVVL